MDSKLTLVCTHGNIVAPVTIYRAWHFGTVIESICSSLSNLDAESVIMSYSMPDHDNSLLDDDDDLSTLFHRADEAGEDVISVAVSVVGQEEGNRVNANDGEIDFDVGGFSGNEMVQPISMYMPGHENNFSNFSTCGSQEEKALLSKEWTGGITGVGQKFEGGAKEFRDKLRKYAIEYGFEYVYVKNESVRVTAQCKFRVAKGCMWHVHARELKVNGFFYVKKFHRAHTCGASVRTFKNKRVTSDLVSSLIVDNIRAQPLKRPSDVVAEMKKDYGLNISYHQAWWGVERARNQIFGDYNTSFESLRWYVGASKSTNHGSHIELDFDHDSNHFKRIFVALGACIRGFNYCRPLLFIDGTFLKGRHRGTLLVATGKNGNQGLFPVCFAVVDAENQENWLWFLQNLHCILTPERTITFVSDRNTGLIEARKRIFPTSGHGYCLQHLKNNLRYHLKRVGNAFRERMVTMLVKCAYAPTKPIFHHLLNDMMREGGHSVAAFFNNLAHENWCNAYFIGNRYGELYSNCAESFNSWIRKERHLPITKLVDAIRVKMMKQMSERRDITVGWASVICPSMDQKLHNAVNDGRTWVVNASAIDVYDVHSFPPVTIDMAQMTCSCRSWQIEGFPCSHAVCAIMKSGKNMNSYVDPYYYVQSFRDSYSFFIYPPQTDWMPDSSISEDVLLPPLTKKPPGRPRTERIPSRGEKLVQQIRCSRCRKMGTHNRKTCKEPI